jgi:hypothetical protein
VFSVQCSVFTFSLKGISANLSSSPQQNQAPPFSKGGLGGISGRFGGLPDLLNPPYPPFFKGGTVILAPMPSR